ncbi:MAG: lycopene cyclase domain-containing protein [Chloroflexi bacterium]|nr:lycopene cyclase domain-containing protein [Chloroflexota bacterium]
MKYFGFLARFVILPLTMLGIFTWFDAKRGKKLPNKLSALPPAAILGAHVGLAVAYTTPWDNYLVKTRVWWYDKKLVTGLILGYVPIEEYTFFVLQTALTGMFLLTMARYTPSDDAPPKNGWRYRVGLTLGLGAVWAWSVYNLITGRKKLTYLSLTLAWGLLPLMFQTAFGGDILVQHRKLVALGIVLPTLYLGVSDSLAIDSGTWSINPEKTVDLHIGGKLPLEEGVFFLLTNVLISVGMTLMLSKESPKRIPPKLRQWLRIRE